MHGPLASLAATLHGSKTFDEAALATLRALLEIAGEALGASPFADRGRLLRAMVHVRPDDGYERLASLEAGGDRVQIAGREPQGEGAYLPSATAWRWVERHGAPVSVDVMLGRVQPHGVSAAPERDRAFAAGLFDSKESARRLLDRAASHLFVVPVRAPGRGAVGMLSVEAECRAATGKAFIWPACEERMQLVADLSAAHLSALSPAAVDAPALDELLPVAGAKMAPIVQMARLFAAQDETLLITGPTGAGKSRLARFCHERSRRRQGPFESMSLLSVPPDLQMGELFGWKKGAFSGAVAEHRGAVARAEQGTLFIDEIDKLSLSAQAGLLQMLEGRTYRPLGEGAGERHASARFIIGTNENLREAVRAGRFREDLYYRINVLPIRLPPLDERKDEIPLWARYMVERRHREAGGAGRAALDPAAEQALLRRLWPGNLRQLDNIVRRAYAFALLDAEGAGGEVRMAARHVDQALAHEDGGDRAAPASARAPAGLIQALSSAAEELVAEAERREAGGERLDLDLCNALRAFALAAAKRRRGSLEEAYRLFGKGSIVENRNQRRAAKRDTEKAAELLRMLGQADPPLLRELEGEDPDGSG